MLNFVSKRNKKVEIFSHGRVFILVELTETLGKLPVLEVSFNPLVSLRSRFR